MAITASTNGDAFSALRSALAAAGVSVGALSDQGCLALAAANILAGAVPLNTGAITATAVAVSGAGGFRIATSTPASAAATGVAGTIAWDDSYIYVCVATNTWERAAIDTWA